MTKKIFFSVADFDDACYRLASDIKLRGIKYQAIYGVPRGGVAIAIRLSSLLDLPIVDEYSTTSKEKILVVDDIV
ncbi:MAG: hypothetical protein M0R03_22690, partial [Novosphingobium sp.]|nr:hypothetical protein [Novosphingobium sp.]